MSVGIFPTRYMKHNRVAVAYPQANGQVENANRTIVDDIKKNLDAAGGTWVEELDTVLWAYRTTPRKATGETPFALAYEFEARAPTEAVIPSYRVAIYDPDLNEQHHATDLHLIDDRREEAMQRAEDGMVLMHGRVVGQKEAAQKGIQGISPLSIETAGGRWTDQSVKAP
ncbi:PREDICTED: uncharacterized protein LOC109166466 [Ipomoea nil]|uniref:uncharacterized protein LOC109166466 n=1 Tax=Ipomoea nil TaxID=35883 RepID=UPI0009012669|nr:PREDICTED: uncharacterized protein LOC109166466 [Ipomoea nil]